MGEPAYLDLKPNETITRLFDKRQNKLTPESLAAAVIAAIESSLTKASGCGLLITADHYHLLLSDEDSMAAGPQSSKKIEALIRGHIEARGYLTAQYVTVEVGSSLHIGHGMPEVMMRYSAGRFILSLSVKDLNTGKEFQASAGEKLSLGRDPKNTIPIPQPYVSSRHAEVALTEDLRIVLTDLGSSNGTYVNDEKVKETALASGARFRLTEEHPQEFQVTIVPERVVT